jgi:hypothetical protein
MDARREWLDGPLLFAPREELLGVPRRALEPQASFATATDDESALARGETSDHLPIWIGLQLEQALVRRSS